MEETANNGIFFLMILVSAAASIGGVVVWFYSTLKMVEKLREKKARPGDIIRLAVLVVAILVLAAILGFMFVKFSGVFK